jgi:hypothetical protein
MRFSLLVVCLVLAQSALAPPLRFTAPCTVDSTGAKVPAHVAKYKMVKEAFVRAKPTPGKKWDYRYFLQVFFKSRPSKAYEYPLVPAGSGDEDYSEWNVKAEGRQLRSINVSGAYIQNNFQWISLIDNDGSAFARCETTKN